MTQDTYTIKLTADEMVMVCASLRRTERLVAEYVEMFGAIKDTAADERDLRLIRGMIAKTERECSHEKEQ